jgi:cytoskeletal protein CcmA (bactofilin family)
MNTSRASSSDLSVTSIRFSDNTVLTSGSTFTSNVHLKKRVRVEGDIDGGGNLIITQNSQVQGNSTVTGTTLLQGNVKVNGTTTFNGTLNFPSSA